MADEEEVGGFGSATEYTTGGKKGDSNAKWIGAKFDLEDTTDKEIVDKATELQGSMSLKKFIAEMIVYVYTREKGE